MPVNFQQALLQIREMGKQAPVLEEKRNALRQQAEELFRRFSGELDTLQQLVDRAAAENPSLRCAAPFLEKLDLTFPEPHIEGSYTLLAADGSQINPDRHGMVEFGAINVGAIQMSRGLAQPPQELVQSQLMFYENLYTHAGSPLTDDLVALMRDLAERRVLMELATCAPEPVVTLTDGPLELFREPKGMAEFAEELEKYHQVLEQMAMLQAVTAGYVDRPRSDLLVRLLELVVLEQHGRLSQAGLERPLRWVNDAGLFLNRLPPGHRSAIFAIRSGSAQSFQGQLQVHFFYLNVGRVGRASLSRVEIPRWVAERPALVDLLHGCLLDQAHHLGARPYPYALHRAHEIAVISFEERGQLENMIVAELRRQGVPVDDQSNKQIAKDSSSSRARSR